MSNPYPVAEQALLCRLTPTGIDRYRTLNDRDEHELDDLRAVRAVHAAEIASIDEVMADLHETIGRRQAKMRGDVISLLPSGSGQSSVNPQGDPLGHQAKWDGFAPPETGVFAAVPDLSPDPDANLERLGEAHDAQDAREGVAR